MVTPRKAAATTVERGASEWTPDDAAELTPAEAELQRLLHIESAAMRNARRILSEVEDVVHMDAQMDCAQAAAARRLLIALAQRRQAVRAIAGAVWWPCHLCGSCRAKGNTRRVTSVAEAEDTDGVSGVMMISQAAATLEAQHAGIARQPLAQVNPTDSGLTPRNLGADASNHSETRASPSTGDSSARGSSGKAASKGVSGFGTRRSSRDSRRSSLEAEQKEPASKRSVEKDEKTEATVAVPSLPMPMMTPRTEELARQLYTPRTMDALDKVLTPRTAANYLARVSPKSSPNSASPTTRVTTRSPLSPR